MSKANDYRALLKDDATEYLRELARDVMERQRGGATWLSEYSLFEAVKLGRHGVIIRWMKRKSDWPRVLELTFDLRADDLNEIGEAEEMEAGRLIQEKLNQALLDEFWEIVEDPREVIESVLPTSYGEPDELDRDYAAIRTDNMKAG